MSFCAARLPIPWSISRQNPPKPVTYQNILFFPASFHQIICLNMKVDSRGKGGGNESYDECSGEFSTHFAMVIATHARQIQISNGRGNWTKNKPRQLLDHEVPCISTIQGMISRFQRAKNEETNVAFRPVRFNVGGQSIGKFGPLRDAFSLLLSVKHHLW